MRIAIVTEVWRPSVNGVVTRLEATVRQLIRVGHEVLVVAPAVEHRGAEEFAGARVRLVPTVRFGFVYGGQTWGLPLPRVGRWLAEFGPDVVHVVNPVLLGMAGVGAARRQGLALVCSYHTDVARYAGFYRLAWIRPALRWVQRRLHGRAALNLVTSSTGAGQLHRLGVRSAGDGAGRIEIWRRGVDLDRFRPASAPDSSTRPATLLYVGRIAAEKGLEALEPLARTPGLQLVFVGDGPDRQGLADRLAGAQVTFTGTLHGEELAAAYGVADVFVFPSTSETLGLVLLEALAAGLPVVAADSPASREVLAGCPVARLYPAGRADLIPELVDELLASAPPDVLAHEARTHVDGYAWPAATNELLDYYRRAKERSEPRQDASAIRDKVHRQLARFGMVGVLNAAVDLGVFNLLLAIGPTRDPGQLVIYNTIAVMAAITNSYWWNSRWTFRNRTVGRGRWTRIRQRALFGAQAALNILVNDGAVATMATLLTANQLLAPLLANNVSKVVGMVVAALVSFVAMRLVVFRHPKPERDPTGDASGGQQAGGNPVRDRG